MHELQPNRQTGMNWAPLLTTQPETGVPLGRPLRPYETGYRRAKKWVRERAERSRTGIWLVLALTDLAINTAASKERDQQVREARKRVLARTVARTLGTYP